MLSKNSQIRKLERRHTTKWREGKGRRNGSSELPLLLTVCLFCLGRNKRKDETRKGDRNFTFVRKSLGITTLFIPKKIYFLNKKSLVSAAVLNPVSIRPFSYDPKGERQFRVNMMLGEMFNS